MTSSTGAGYTLSALKKATAAGTWNAVPCANSASPVATCSIKYDSFSCGVAGSTPGCATSFTAVSSWAVSSCSAAFCSRFAAFCDCFDCFLSSLRNVGSVRRR